MAIAIRKFCYYAKLNSANNIFKAVNLGYQNLNLIIYKARRKIY